jgi:hypothetical protein
MTIPERSPPTLWPTMPSDKDSDKQLETALEEIVKDRWINDFIKRLNYTIGDIVRKTK